MFRTICFCTTMVAALALAGSASPLAIPNPPCPNTQTCDVYTAGYQEDVTDATGAILSSSTLDGLPAGQAWGDGDDTDYTVATDMDGGPAAALVASPAVDAVALPDGCKTVDYFVTKQTALFGRVAWRYHQLVHFCWSYPRITSLSVSDEFSPVDSQQTVNTTGNGWGWYYSWRDSTRGGHFSHRQGSISNCILKYGCISTSYPHVDVWVNGNGAWKGTGSK